MNIRTIFRTDELDELGYEIEWIGSYLNLSRNGKHVDCRSYNNKLSYDQAVILVEEYINDLFHDAQE